MHGRVPSRDDCLIKQTRFAIIANIFTYYKKEPNAPRAGKNARIAWGTYTGTGTYGAANPTGLTFDFYPVMVWVGCENCAGVQSWPSTFIRGCPASHPDVTPNLLTVTWTDNGVSWYDTRYSHGQLQNNDQGVTYYYCVLGYDKNAENG